MHWCVVVVVWSIFRCVYGLGSGVVCFISVDRVCLWVVVVLCVYLFVVGVHGMMVVLVCWCSSRCVVGAMLL